MSVVTTLCCECNPGHNYASTSTFKAHKTSKRHTEWEKGGDVKQLRLLLAEAESKNAKLNKRIHDLEEMIRNRSLTPRKRRVSHRTKQEVAAAGGWICSDCKNALTPNYEIDHTKPLFQGGTNETSNLRAKCPECHRNKTYADMAGVAQIDSVKPVTAKSVETKNACEKTADNTSKRARRKQPASASATALVPWK